MQGVAASGARSKVIDRSVTEWTGIKVIDRLVMDGTYVMIWPRRFKITFTPG